jgi:hypothetical protein
MASSLCLKLALPDDLLLFILDYLSSSPLCIHTLISVCKHWLQRFHPQDRRLWTLLASLYRVPMHSSQSRLSLRSKTQCKQLFFKAFYKRQKELYEKHDQLLLTTKSVLARPQDCPHLLQKLIKQHFPDPRDFDVNWRCATLEDNCLLLVLVTEN